MQPPSLPAVVTSVDDSDVVVMAFVVLPVTVVVVAVVVTGIFVVSDPVVVVVLFYIWQIIYTPFTSSHELQSFSVVLTIQSFIVVILA